MCPQILDLMKRYPIQLYCVFNLTVLGLETGWLVLQLFDAEVDSLIYCVHSNLITAVSKSHSVHIMASLKHGNRNFWAASDLYLVHSWERVIPYFAFYELKLGKLQCQHCLDAEKSLNEDSIQSTCCIASLTPLMMTFFSGIHKIQSHLWVSISHSQLSQLCKDGLHAFARPSTCACVMMSYLLTRVDKSIVMQTSTTSSSSTSATSGSGSNSAAYPNIYLSANATAQNGYTYGGSLYRFTPSLNVQYAVDPMHCNSYIHWLD